MTHFDSNNNKIKNENVFRTKRERILDLENDLKKDEGNVLEEDVYLENGLRIKTRRFTLDFEDIYDYSKKIMLESRTS